MGVHDGHRDRLKARYKEEGLDHFEPHIVLELLLFYAVPRKDTNELGHALLERFGSLAGVFEANIDELVQVQGIGEHAAALLTMVPQLARRYKMDKYRDICLNSTEKAGEYLMDFYTGKGEEEVVMIGLDAKCRMLGTFVLHKGSVNSASVSTRKLLSRALGCNAIAVILSHNHPGGVALPSPEDIDTTRKLIRSLQDTGIILQDHIIVADDDFVSFAESGLL